MSSEVYGNDSPIYNTSTDYIKYRGQAQAFRNQFHVSIDQAGLANELAATLSNQPRPLELVILMRTNQQISWATCEPPLNYFSEPLFSLFVLNNPDLTPVIGKLMTTLQAMTSQTTSPSTRAPRQLKQAKEGESLIAMVRVAIDQNDMINMVRSAMDSFLKA